MKKVFLVCIVLTIALMGTTVLSKSQTSNAISSRNNELKTSHDVAELAKIGYKLDVPNEIAKTSPENAQSNVKAAFPALANRIPDSLEYQALTVPSFNSFSHEALEKNPVLKAKNAIDHLPVYIISFKNMNVPNYGGLPGAPAFYSAEINVVVDATSGVPLMSFSYR